MGVDISTWRSRVGSFHQRGSKKVNVSIKSAPVWFTLNIGHIRIYISPHHTIYLCHCGDQWEYYNRACPRSHHILQILQCLIQSARSAKTPGYFMQLMKQIFKLLSLSCPDFHQNLFANWLLLILLPLLKRPEADISVPSKQCQLSWEHPLKQKTDNDSMCPHLALMLIMLCGDVELNPGPTPNPVNPHYQNNADRARDLTKYTIPLRDLNYPEYCCNLNIDFTLKKSDVGYSDQMAVVLRMLCAMLNYAGGVITLNPQVACTDKDRDEWVGKLQQIQDIFIPREVSVSCIEVKTQTVPIEIWLKRSWKFITYKTHFYTKRDNTTTEGDTTMISESLNTPIRRVSRVDTIKWTHFNHGDTFHLKEDKHLEFKCYESASNANSLMQILFTGHLQQTKVIKTSFGYANTTGGGDLLIGVKEDTNGVGILQGQKLLSADEQIVDAEFNRIMTVGDNGELRIWPSPPSGVEWMIKFYPLGNCPNNERRVIIHIRMNQVAGGVFADEPEAYTMTPEGDVRHVPYKEWRELISDKITKQQSFSVGPGPLPNIPDDVQEQSTIDVEQLKKLAKDLKRHKVALSFDDTKIASWTQDAEDSKESINIAPGVNMKSSVEELSKSELLMPRYPHRWVPEKMILNRWITNTNQDLADCVAALEQNYLQESIVIIGSKSFKCLFPGLTITEPNNHVFDFVVIHKDANIDMWSTVEDRGSVEKSKEYINSTIRMLRAKIISYVQHHMNIKVIDVAIRAFIWNIEDKCLQYCTPIYISSTIDLPVLQEATAHCLLKGHSHIWNRLGEEYLTTLTKDQLSGLLHCQYSNVIVYQGPPGSGKSILALNICEQEAQSFQLARNQILYICSNQPLAEYIKFQQKCEVVVMQYGDDLVQAILLALQNGKLRVIIDDAHLQQCSKPQWVELFEVFHQQDAGSCQPRRLAILLDPAYQNFQSDNTEELFQAVKEYNGANEYSQIHVSPAFPRMIRNCRKVFTFFKTNAEGKGKDQLICCHDFQGDDVSLHYTMEDFFLYAGNNPLLLLTKEFIGLYNFEEKFTYQPNDITILVDSNGMGEAKVEVDKYINIFCQFYPDANVQRATRFPVEGVVIDELKAFSGLESRVCILVLTTKETTVMENYRYKLFVSSRGITKVVFLLHGDTVESTLGQLKFSEEKQWQKVSRALWREIPWNVLAADNPNGWILRNVPYTDTWQKRTEPVLQLCKLLEENESKEEVKSCLEQYLEDERIQVLEGCILFLVNKDATFQTISEWLSDNVEGEQDRFMQCWKSAVIFKCHLMIEKYGRDLSNWMDEHILPAWRRDQQFLQDVIEAVCKGAVTIREVDPFIGEYIDLICYLASWNCLYGAPDANQDLDTAYSQLHSLYMHQPGGRIHEMFYVLNYDCCISRHALSSWLQSLDQPTPRCLEEHDLMQGLKKRIRTRQEARSQTESIMPLMKDALYYLPQYQRLVLTVLCQEAITWQEEQCKVDSTILLFYIPQLFCNIEDKQQLLCAVQTVLYQLRNPPGLAAALLQALLLVTREGTWERKGLQFTTADLVGLKDNTICVMGIYKHLTLKGPFIRLLELFDENKMLEDIKDWILQKTSKKYQAQAFQLVVLCLMKDSAKVDMTMMWIMQNIPEEHKPEAYLTMVICLINKELEAVQIRKWISDNLPQDTQTFVHGVRLVESITCGTPHKDIRQWLSIHIPEKSQTDLQVLWRIILSRTFHLMVLSMHYEDLSDWMNSNVPPDWRLDHQFLEVMVGSFCEEAVTNCGYDIEIMDLRGIRYYLGCSNCLYGAPAPIQYLALNTMYNHAKHIYGVMLCGLLQFLLQDCFISKVNMDIWYQSLDKDCEYTHWIDIDEVMDSSEQDIIADLKEIIRNKQEIGSWMSSTLDMDDWYNIPHYQRVVLKALCQEAVTQEGDTFTVDKHLLQQYIPQLFCDVEEKHQLLYAVQTVACTFDKQFPLAEAILQNLLEMRDESGESIYSIDDILQWKDTENPVYDQGRDIPQALEIIEGSSPVIKFQQGIHGDGEEQSLSKSSTEQGLDDSLIVSVNTSDDDPVFIIHFIPILTWQQS